MDICVLNDHYEMVQVVDQFDSFCWTDRYYEAGEFELQALADITILSYIQKGLYLKIKDSDRLMIIDTIEFTSDVENGDHLKATGQSLERILKWRVVLNEITLDGSLQEGIMRLLNDNIIDPTDSRRMFPIITFKKSDDPAITSIMINITFKGENLYDAISGLCQAYNIGFKMTPDYTNYGFIFELYAGADRSYNQTTLPQIVFSPEYENIIDSSYVDSDQDTVNMVYVVNENDGITLQIYNGSAIPEGRGRKELFLNSSASKPQVEAYESAESYINRDDFEDIYETHFDENAYNEAVEKQRQRARDQIAAAGGTEADISWPPAGREGQSYEDYLALHVPTWPYMKTTLNKSADQQYQEAVDAANAEAMRRYQQALANADATVRKEMTEEGQLALIDKRTQKTFDGNIVNYFQFVANRDYGLGDVVQMVSSFKGLPFISIPTRLTELSFCYDESGASVVPTFATDVDTEPEEVS